jgi:glycerophosphoryl diester phosphodiesterase
VKPSFWVIGHRGSPILEVENTIESFTAALDEGANALEVDVSVTGDGRGVLWHDWDPNYYKSILRALGVEPGVGHRPVMPFGRYRRRVSELSLRDFLAHHGYAPKRLGASRLDVRVPTLRDLFEWGIRQPRLHGLFLDVKIPRSEIPLVSVFLSELDELVLRVRPSFRVVLETAEVDVLAELKRLGSSHAACFDVEPSLGLVLDTTAHSAVRKAIAHGAHIAGPQRPRALTALPFRTHHRIVSEDVALQQKYNARSPRVPLEGVVSFTINDEREMLALIRLGVAGIQTDRPSLLYKVAERCGKMVRWLPPPAVPKSRLAFHDGQALRGHR